MATLEELTKVGQIDLGPNPPDPEKVRNETQEFIEIDNEIDKLGGLQADTIQWYKIVDSSALILRENSKDWRAASYLCFALFKRDNYHGLVAGFTVLRDLIDQHWEKSYPYLTKLKERLRELTWLNSQLGRVLPDPSSGPLQPTYKKPVTQCHELLTKINILLADKIGKEVLQVLLEEELNKKLTKVERESLTVAQKEERLQKLNLADELFLRQLEKQFQAYQERFAKPEPEQPATPPPPKERTLTFKTLQEDLFNIAVALRRQNIFDPIAYRITRFEAWLFVEEIPNHDKSTKLFKVAGPTINILRPPKEVGELDELFVNGEYVELINKAEETFAKSTAPPRTPYCYWLDAHRLTVQSLEKLKVSTTNKIEVGQATVAKQIIIEELARFLRRLPGIQDLSFYNEVTNETVAFADDKTKLWIQNAVLATDETSTKTTSEIVVQPWLVVAKQARQFAVDNQFEAGLNLLYEGGRRANSRREQFSWWLEQARFYYDTQHHELAISQLEFLETQVQRFGLEEWEPQLSVEVARLLLLCYNKTAKKLDALTQPQGSTELFRPLYARLCRLDLSAALEVVKN
ncbi:MAG: type VI secretion system ImpA domain-containing protein [Thiotrichaceae bacterium IS1]|nr:MAG: type VI secretion system ImpA domain-containing protein [Thiotrichaceae bacterium IS1]